MKKEPRKPPKKGPIGIVESNPIDERIFKWIAERLLPKIMPKTLSEKFTGNWPNQILKEIPKELPVQFQSFPSFQKTVEKNPKVITKGFCKKSQRKYVYK